jgi:alginate O-acetyltransferase complex protein AlgI
MLTGMVGLNHNGFINLEVTTTFKNNIFFIIVAIIACTPLPVQLYKWMCRRCKTNIIFKYLRRVIEVAGPVFLLVLATMALVGNSYNPFLYFQF